MNNLNIEKKDFLQIGVSGLNPEIWNRLEGQFADLIEKLCDRIGADNSDQQLTKDIVQLGFNFAKAKIEKPSLENEKLKAEIANNYADANKKIFETEKIKEDIIEKKLENLERLLTVFKNMNGSNIHFSTLKGSSNLFIGNVPNDIEAV